MKRFWARKQEDVGGELPAEASEHVQVEGERGIASINRERSLQSRFSNILALGLMSVVTLGLLTWYYTRVMARPANEQRSAEAVVKQRAQTEMPLPPLGRVDPVPAPSFAAPPATPAPEEEWAALGAFARPPEPAFDLDPGVDGGGNTTAMTAAAATVRDRRLLGPVFVGNASATPGSDVQSSAPAPVMAAIGSDVIASTAGHDELEGKLKPAVTKTVEAQVLPTQRLLLPKGAFIDCTLETAIDSTLPGMTTCVMATDSFSADGTVVLLERGTKLVGETRGQVQQGSARVFVLWTQARTPEGVVVPLDSPGTDELGRSGLKGEVNRHFWERFGAAILISVIDGAIQAAVQSESNGGTVIVNPSATSTVMTEVLKSTINIPPTVVKHNGDRIQVLVARDLDFRSVYELRAAGTP